MVAKVLQHRGTRAKRLQPQKEEQEQSTGVRLAGTEVSAVDHDIDSKLLLQHASAPAQ